MANLRVFLSNKSASFKILRAIPLVTSLVLYVFLANLTNSFWTSGSNFSQFFSNLGSFVTFNSGLV